MKFLIDPKTASIEDANTAACKFFGITKKEFTVIPPPWFIDVDEVSLRQGLQMAMEGKQDRFIGSRRTPGGQIRTMEVWISPLKIAEKDILYAVAFDITERISQENVIREKNAALKSQKRSLAEKSIAIQEITGQVEQSRTRAIAAMAEEIKSVMLPIIARIRSCRIDDSAQRLVDVLDRSVREVSVSGNERCDISLQRLTMREREICNLIRNGLSSKEIADILGISYRSVENHRHTVRRKLGFDRSINLGSFLSNCLK